MEQRNVRVKRRKRVYFGKIQADGDVDTIVANDHYLHKTQNKHFFKESLVSKSKFTKPLGQILMDKYTSNFFVFLPPPPPF